MRRLAALVRPPSRSRVPPWPLRTRSATSPSTTTRRVHLSGDRVFVHEVLDLAEIPTLQERGRIESPGFARELATGLDVRVDGRRVPLRVVAAAARSRPGAGGLETLRFEAVYEALAKGDRVAFADRTFPRRRGWREIVVTADRGARVLSSSAPSTSESAALTSPADLLRSRSTSGRRPRPTSREASEARRLDRLASGHDQGGRLRVARLARPHAWLPRRLAPARGLLGRRARARARATARRSWPATSWGPVGAPATRSPSAGSSR